MIATSTKEADMFRVSQQVVKTIPGNKLDAEVQSFLNANPHMTVQSTYPVTIQKIGGPEVQNLVVFAPVVRHAAQG